jgi:hypothetical protein
MDLSRFRGGVIIADRRGVCVLQGDPPRTAGIVVVLSPFHSQTSALVADRLRGGTTVLLVSDRGVLLLAALETLAMELIVPVGTA